MTNTVSHKQLNKLRSAHGRRKTGLSVCEGMRCCRELITRQPTWARQVFFDEEATGDPLQDLRAHCHEQEIPVESIPSRDFKGIAQTETPQGVLIVFAPPRPGDVEASASIKPRDPFLLILDQVQDPGNVGTILRTAWGAGLHQICLTRGTASPFAPKTIRAGMGAQFAVTTHVFEGLDAAYAAVKESGYTHAWVAAASEGCSCFNTAFDLRDSALIIGNEGAGTRPPAHAETSAVHIPMPGSADSLNVAQATTILLFDAVRRGILPAEG